MIKLTEKQKKFIDKYVACGNARIAAIVSGYSRSNAKKAGEKNLKNPAIQYEIKILLGVIKDFPERKPGEETLKFKNKNYYLDVIECLLAFDVLRDKELHQEAVDVQIKHLSTEDRFYLKQRSKRRRNFFWKNGIEYDANAAAQHNIKDFINDKPINKEFKSNKTDILIYNWLNFDAQPMLNNNNLHSVALLPRYNRGRIKEAMNNQSDIEKISKQVFFNQRLKQLDAA